MKTLLNKIARDKDKLAFTNKITLKESIYLSNFQWFKGSRDRGIR